MGLISVDVRVQLITICCQLRLPSHKPDRPTDREDLRPASEAYGQSLQSCGRNSLVQRLRSLAANPSYRATHRRDHIYSHSECGTCMIRGDHKYADPDIKLPGHLGTTNVAVLDVILS